MRIFPSPKNRIMREPSAFVRLRRKNTNLTVGSNISKEAQYTFSSACIICFNYRTRAIITRGLYIFYPTFILKCGLYYRPLYGLKTEILHFLSLKSAVSIWERFLIKSGLYWRAYGIYCHQVSCCTKLSDFEDCKGFWRLERILGTGNIFHIWKWRFFAISNFATIYKITSVLGPHGGSSSILSHRHPKRHLM